MKGFICKVISVALAACMAILSHAGEAPDSVFCKVLFKPGDAGSRFYRIPALLTAADGSIVAAADKRNNNLGDLPNDIDVVCRRSTDMGATWSDAVTIAGDGTATGYGDPALVLDRRTGRILCFMVSGNGFWQSNADDYQRLMLSVSDDNGLSWSAPRDITPQIYGPACPDAERCKWLGAFFSSGNALQLSDGRIMIVIPTRLTPERGGKISCYAVFSDDGGDTWGVSRNPGDFEGDEAKVVELSTGDVLMSIRNPKKGQRRFSISHDRGETWGEAYCQPDIIEPACNGDIIRYRYGSRDFLLHSVPFDEKERKNVSVLASFDEGMTWRVRRTLVPGGSAYSSLAVLPDGSIGCFVEEGDYRRGFELKFMRFTPEWLLRE
ncbi:MAG: exo-alpha-sialidase [Muribaculaceae bacterium]